MKLKLPKLPPPFDIILQAIKGWSADDVPRLGASLAYYTLFSLAPILLIAITIAGWVFGAEAVRGQMTGELNDLIGQDGAEAVQALLQGAALQNGSTLALIIGGVVFLLASTGAFLELQHALNKIFQVKTKPDANVATLIKRRAQSFGLVITLGFLLMVSLAVSAALSALSQWMHADSEALVWRAVDTILSLGVITLLFAVIYRFLPDVHLEWREVWTGALVTAVLFSVGKFLIGLYLGRTSMASSYGAIGSILVLLVWVYYSSQIILLGAEITRVYAARYTGKPKPDRQVGVRDQKAHPAAARAK